MAQLRAGAAAISTLRCGADAVRRVYHGAVQVWGRRTPTIVGFGTAAAASGNTLTFTAASLPALQAGDLLVACVRCGTTGSTSEYTSTGFVRLSEPIAAGAGNRLSGTLGKFVGAPASEPTQYTFTFTGTGMRQCGVLLVVRGVDQSAPLSGATGANAGASFPTTAGSLILACVANETVSPHASEPSVVDPDYQTVTTASSAAATSTTRSVLWAGSLLATSDVAPGSSDTTWPANAARTFWSISVQGAP